MSVLRRAEKTPAARKKEPLPSRGPPDVMIAFQPAETFVRGHPTANTALRARDLDLGLGHRQSSRASAILNGQE
jgi:hypothetical protein